jgi:hypothetical protein
VVGIGSGIGGAAIQLTGLDWFGGTYLGKAGPRWDSVGYAGPWSVCSAAATQTLVSNAATVNGTRSI